MKTDELINAIAADAKAAPAPIGRTVWLAGGIAAALAAAMFFAVLPLRADMPEVIGEPRFLFKWIFTLSLLASALIVTVHLARPQGIPRALLLLLLVAPTVLIFGIASELATLPASQWIPTMVGVNSAGCIVLIPLLSALPLGAIMLALRRGAPDRPALAGAVAGLAAAGIAATFYAMYCRDDSPLFLGLWYILATALVAIVGALIGARVLRW